MPTEKEIEAEARKQCLRAFEPYTYGPYFDALRDEYRRKASEILEARERTEEYAGIFHLRNIFSAPHLADVFNGRNLLHLLTAEGNWFVVHTRR